MLYQKMLTGDRPYHAKKMKMGGFEAHKHPEVELSYCVSGEYSILIDGKRYVLHKGDLAVIGVMTAHEIPFDNVEPHEALVIEVGPMFLSGYFGIFSERPLSEPIIRAEKELQCLLDETAEISASEEDFSELTVRGNLYKICARLLSLISKSDACPRTACAIRSVASVEKALEMIRSRYAEPLSVTEVAAVCGYTKSNFCKIFKNATGETFHYSLNKRRINVACELLTETAQSVEAVALQVGFPDGKSLCRAFRAYVGVTPLGYRRGAGGAI